MASGHIEKHLYLPQGTVEIVHSYRDLEDSKRGCFNAHFHIYQLIVERGYKSCIIFEDDVHFLRKIKESEYAEFLDSHDWDVFYGSYLRTYLESCTLYFNQVIVITENE